MARDVRVQRTKNGYVQIVTDDNGVMGSYRGADAGARASQRAATLSRAAFVLDKHIPTRGQCLICGIPGVDASHRVIDSIAGMARAELAGGKTDVSWVAEEFGYDGGKELVDACLVWTCKKGD